MTVSLWIQLILLGKDIHVHFFLLLINLHAHSTHLKIVAR